LLVVVFGFVELLVVVFGSKTYKFKNKNGTMEQRRIKLAS